MLVIWVIYKHPADYPDHYVARPWQGNTPADTVFKSVTLEGIRDMIPRGLYRQNRSPGDDPVIVETWF